MARQGVELHPREAEGAVAEQEDDLALGPRELGGQRVAGPRAQASEGPGVEPASRPEGVHHPTGIGDEVASVADDDGVAIEHLGELGVDAHGMKRRAVILEL